MDTSLVLDLSIRVRTHGNYYTVTVVNNGTGEEWTKQRVAFSAVEAAVGQLRSIARLT